MPRPNHIQAVIFDFDGTSADTEAVKCAYVQRQLNAAGIPITFADALTLAGGDDRLTMPGLVASYGFDMTYEEVAALIPDIDDVYAKGDIEPSPGLVGLVRDLRSRGVRTAIASSSATAHVLVALDRMGIVPLFDAVVGGDMVRSLKPSPDLYATALEYLGVLPEHGVAVEDSPFGVESAHAAGLYVIGYHGSTAKLDVSAADEVIDTFVGLSL